MQAALVARLTAASALSALIGNRVSWFERPRRGGLPAVTLTRVAPGRDYTMDGTSQLEFAWVQFDLWSSNMDQLAALEAVVIAEMETAASVGGVVFEPGFLEGNRSFDPEDLEGGVRVYRAALDFRFYHEPEA